ncbi:MAG: hypothetical protein WCG87_12790, partial [Bacteroidota bacterium]
VQMLGFKMLLVVVAFWLITQVEVHFPKEDNQHQVELSACTYRNKSRRSGVGLLCIARMYYSLKRLSGVRSCKKRTKMR